MSPDYNFVTQASNLGKILLKGDDSEILANAEEILFFLNKLQDVIKLNPKSPIPLSSFSDIKDRLETDPEATLKENDVRTRLVELFAKVVR
jgi:hypothetical protein